MGNSTKNEAAAQHPDTALCTMLPPQPAPPAQLPLPNSDSPAAGTGCPGTPPTRDRRRSSGPGVSARSLLRPGPHAGRARTRSAAPPLSSLHDPRHRSCTGSRLLAALPDLHALRHCSGKAAAAGSGLELRNETESGSCAWPNSAHNSASVIRNCKQLPCCLWQHSYNSCYAHNRPRRPTAASGQGLRAAAAKLLLLPSAERPAAAARCCSSPGRASVSGWRHLGPQLLHGAAAARAGQSRAAPLAGPRPRPSRPAQAAAKPGLSAWLCLLLQHRKSPTG